MGEGAQSYTISSRIDSKVIFTFSVVEGRGGGKKKPLTLMMLPRHPENEKKRKLVSGRFIKGGERVEKEIHTPK